MSDYRRIDGSKEALRKTRRKLRKRSPCGRPPAAPTGLTGSFVRHPQAKHNRIRARVKWDEVVQDTSGLPVRIRHYRLELEYTSNGSDWFLDRRVAVAQKDQDEGSKDHYVFTHIQKNLGYRFRVRAIAQDGCKSAWSPYYVLGNPGVDEPPAPANVKIDDRDNKKRVDVSWSTAESPDDSDLFDDRVNHVLVVISKSSDFSTVYAKARTKSNRQSFKIAPADVDSMFYARARSVSADGDKSAWIPATIAGNSDPNASPDGVSVGAADREVATFSVSGNLQVRHYPAQWTNTTGNTLKFKRARVRVGRHDPGAHPNDGCPIGGPIKVQLVLHSADDSTETNLFDADDRLKIDANTHRDANPASSFQAASIAPDEGITVKIVEVGSTSPGSDLVLQLVMEPD